MLSVANCSGDTRLTCKYFLVDDNYFSAADLLPRDLEPLEDAWELAGAGVDRALDPEADELVVRVGGPLVERSVVDEPRQLLLKLDSSVIELIQQILAMAQHCTAHTTVGHLYKPHYHLETLLTA